MVTLGLPFKETDTIMNTTRASERDSASEHENEEGNSPILSKEHL